MPTVRTHSIKLAGTSVVIDVRINEAIVVVEPHDGVRPFFDEGERFNFLFQEAAVLRGLEAVDVLHKTLVDLGVVVLQNFV